ncbi:MAG: tyrosine-protein phosphatase [Clostridiales bacterium]|nr:tyrosine-protein phosphatase [Clostridiales bacterium]
MTQYNPDSQRLYFHDMINVRDLGGMPLSGGKTFAKDRFIRSGSPSIGSDDIHELLIAHGVRTVVDLRSKSEVAHYGNPFRDDGVTKFYNIPLFVGDPDAKTDPTMMFLRTHLLGDFYVVMLKELGPAIAEVLRVFIRETDGKILFHCAHGKDRTGVIAAIMYLIAGADKEDIVTNYKVSYEYARHFLDPLIEVKEEQMRHTLRSDEINMRIMLKYIDEAYGGDIRKYLRHTGMSETELDTLYKRCI